MCRSACSLLMVSVARMHYCEQIDQRAEIADKVLMRERQYYQLETCF